MGARLRFREEAWGLAVLAAVAFDAAVAQSPSVAPVDPGQKSVQIARTATRPTIDGALDEAVWANAARIDNFHQVNPVEYAEPSERTEIYLLYDDDALYIGATRYSSRSTRSTRAAAAISSA
jgi:hypothetical protein